MDEQKVTIVGDKTWQVISTQDGGSVVEFWLAAKKLPKGVELYCRTATGPPKDPPAPCPNRATGCATAVHETPVGEEEGTVGVTSARASKERIYLGLGGNGYEGHAHDVFVRIR